MNKLIKKINIVVSFVVMFIITSTISAASLNSDRGIGVLAVKANNGSYTEGTLYIKNGDTLKFDIHAYAGNGDVDNFYSHMTNIHNLTGTAGSTKTVNAYVKGSNASRVYGSVKLHFRDNSKLVFDRYAWGNLDCNHNPIYKTFPNGQNGYSVMDSDGVYLGTLKNCYTSNVLMYFKVKSNNSTSATKIDGKCSSVVDKCTQGTYSSDTDTSTLDKWKCLGKNGGVTAYCSKSKSKSNPVQTAINGICGNTVNQCISGISQDISDTSDYYRWICNGSNGGYTRYCYIKKTTTNPPVLTKVNGLCSTVLNACRVGTWKDVSDTAYSYRWKCEGSNGGSSDYCVKSKQQPINNQVNGGWTSWVVLSYGSWSSCSNGNKQRTVYYTRSCTNPAPANGGAYCSGSNTKTEIEYQACATPINGGWSVWHRENTSTCVNGVRTVYYTRSCTNPAPANGGTYCSGSNTKTETEYCNSPIDGGWSDWLVRNYGDWSTCSNGKQYRYIDYERTCTNPIPANGGANCSGSSTKREGVERNCQVEEYGDVRTSAATKIETHSAKLNGYVVDGNLNDVWFAFSSTDATPSCNSSSQRVEANGGRDEGDRFYTYVNNLTQNTRYYFRACGEDTRGDLVSGSIRTFRTDTEEVFVPARVYTKDATNIHQYTAQLNGYIDINDTKNGKVYFVYGKSPNYMVNKTSELSVTSNTAFQAITGLDPDTVYYYQAIIKDDNGIVDRGVIKNFKTEKVTKVVVNGKCSSRVNRCVRGYFRNIQDTLSYYRWACDGYNGGSTDICYIKKPAKKIIPKKKKKEEKCGVEITETIIPQTMEVVIEENVTTTSNVGGNSVKHYEERGLEVQKTVGKSRRGVFSTEVNAAVKDTIFYKIKVKNTSNETLDVKLEDFIPEELDEKDGTTDDSDRFMTWIFKIAPGQTKIFVKELVVGEDVKVGEDIESSAQITLDNITEDTNQVIVHIVDGKNSTTDNWGFPSIFGWLVLLILGAILGYLITVIFGTLASRKEDKK